MSRAQVITVVIATLVGIGNGFYVFQPYLREKEEDKARAKTRSNELLLPSTAKPATQIQQADRFPNQGHPDGFSQSSDKPKSVWTTVREYASRTYEPGELRDKWSQEGKDEK